MKLPIGMKKNGKLVCIDRYEEPMICVSGVRGKGMSGSALNLASRIDSDFSADNVVFSIEEFNKLLENND